MKHLSMLAAGALVFGLWSCSNEDLPAPGTDPNSEGDVYARITLSLPQTRSETTDPKGDVPASSDAGTEVGQDYENNVENLIVILATKEGNDYKYVTSSGVTGAILDQSKTAPTYSVQFQSSAVENVAGENGADVYVFAIANPTTEMVKAVASLNANDPINDLDAKLTDWTADKNLPWGGFNHNFTMTNAFVLETHLPDYQTLLTTYNSKAKAFNLGTVKVERVVSRFDFVSKAAATTDGVETDENQYLITDNVSDLPVAKIELDGMALFNVAKDFYYFPHMSDSEKWSDPVLCGYETSTNWVVSPNYAGKNGFANGAAYSTVSGNYFYNLDTTPKNLVYSMPGDLDDNHNKWSPSDGTNYKIWTYATENTMPTAAQKYGITTGVAFRTKLVALTDAEIAAYTGKATATNAAMHPAVILRKAMTDGENIFGYSLDGTAANNVILGSAFDVWKYCFTHTSSNIRTSFMEALTAGKFSVVINGKAVTTEAEVFPKPNNQTYDEWAKTNTVTVTSTITTNEEGLTNGFMVYVPNAERIYYCYYRYYNRHNDNGQIEKMGPMEFATVRNNIYKLRVSTIAGFGTPVDFPTEPPTDDETPEIYFKVNVTVLDWVVRLNDIPL